MPIIINLTLFHQDLIVLSSPCDLIKSHIAKKIETRDITNTADIAIAMIVCIKYPIVQDWPKDIIKITKNKKTIVWWYYSDWLRKSIKSHTIVI